MEPATSILSPHRLGPVADRAQARAVTASRADVTGPEETVSFSLTAGRMASPAARRSLIADDGFFPSSVRDDVVLLVTELLTTAVRHPNAEPGRAMRVELRRWADFVRVEVFGEGAGFSADGPGLALVDRIADRWAIVRTASGTCAWFEIRTGDEREGDKQRVDPTRARTGRPASVLKKGIALYAAFARKRFRPAVAPEPLAAHPALGSAILCGRLLQTGGGEAALEEVTRR
jgi:hypothetical protein